MLPWHNHFGQGMAWLSGCLADPVEGTVLCCTVLTLCWIAGLDCCICSYSIFTGRDQGDGSGRAYVIDSAVEPSGRHW